MSYVLPRTRSIVLHVSPHKSLTRVLCLKSDEETRATAVLHVSPHKNLARVLCLNSDEETSATAVLHVSPHRNLARVLCLKSCVCARCSALSANGNNWDTRPRPPPGHLGQSEASIPVT